MRVRVAHKQAPRWLGELPDGVEVTVGDDPGDAEFWVPPFLGRPAPVDPAGPLRVVQLLTAGFDAWKSLPPHVTLCRARGVHTAPTSEWVLTAILSYLHRFPAFAQAQQRQEWAWQITDELVGKRVLIVGAGEIGSAVAARLAPFEVRVTGVANRARDGVHGVDELPALLPAADIVVLLVPLTPATTGLVDAAFLAAMPDGALLVNAARGPVVDTDALVAEVETGRIGAALDVTDPEPLPAGHPLWNRPNVLITPHVGGSVPGTLRRGYALAGDQLRRYVAGQPLLNVVSGDY